MVSDNHVIRADYMNDVPMWPDQDPDTTGVQTAQTRKLKEDADAGDPVGDPVVASDEGADGSQETTTLFELTAGGTVGGDEIFVIDNASGQVAVGEDADFDYEDDGNR